MTRDPVPFDKVEALAANIRELQELERRKAATQAQMIRWCVQALNQTTDQARRRLEAQLMQDIEEGKRRPTARVGFTEPSKKVREDRHKAILYLEMLATSLENQSVRSPDDNQPKEPEPCTPE